MAKLKPWFHVVQPREDLREGKPLDASSLSISTTSAMAAPCSTAARPGTLAPRAVALRPLPDGQRREALGGWCARAQAWSRVLTATLFAIAT